MQYPSVAYITGCDGKFFLLAQALRSSFFQHCPGRTLWVCDYGLSEAQKEDFRAQHALLERPPALPDKEHPWFYKAHLRSYAESLEAEWLVWLDSDCLITGPFSDAVGALIDALPSVQEVVAICRGRIGSTFQIAHQFSGTPGLMARHQLPGQTPYYNTGVCIVRSPGLLRAWSEEIASISQGGMFEQDLFNVLLQRERVPVVPLDHDIWNVTHHALDECTVDNRNVYCRGKRVLVGHATGSYHDVTVDIAGCSGYFRALNNPELWELQQKALSRWH